MALRVVVFWPKLLKLTFAIRVSMMTGNARSSQRGGGTRYLGYIDRRVRLTNRPTDYPTWLTLASSCKSCALSNCPIERVQSSRFWAILARHDKYFNAKSEAIKPGTPTKASQTDLSRAECRALFESLGQVCKWLSSSLALTLRGNTFLK